MYGVLMPEAFRLVIVESPYGGEIERNLLYLRRAMADCLVRGEAPFASHGLYTQNGVLNDADPDQRQYGMHAGFAWAMRADYSVAYCDLGESPGMTRGIMFALEHGRLVEFRRFDGAAIGYARMFKIMFPNGRTVTSEGESGYWKTPSRG